MKVDFHTQTAGSVAVQAGDALAAVREAYNKAVQAFPIDRAPAIVEVRIIAQQRIPNGS